MPLDFPFKALYNIIMNIMQAQVEAWKFLNTGNIKHTCIRYNRNLDQFTIAGDYPGSALLRDEADGTELVMFMSSRLLTRGNFWSVSWMEGFEGWYHG